jgi:hypothetical protein
VGELGEGTGEPYSIGNAQRRLARLAATPEERDRHVQAARAALAQHRSPRPGREALRRIHAVPLASHTNAPPPFTAPLGNFTFSHQSLTQIEAKRPDFHMVKLKSGSTMSSKQKLISAQAPHRGQPDLLNEPIFPSNPNINKPLRQFRAEPIPLWGGLLNLRNRLAERPSPICARNPNNRNPFPPSALGSAIIRNAPLSPLRPNHHANPAPP